MASIITLTTDFGLSDAYVAAMKGVILGINPDARIIDICHTIEPQNITQAGFVISTAYLYFPANSIHVLVVDPGVGSRRRAVLLHTPHADFIAPDNGVLSHVIQKVTGKPITGNRVKLNRDVAAISLTRRRYWLPRVSPTFHGRDIFAPVAAHLSLGKVPEAFGERISFLTTVPLVCPHKSPAGLTGHVIHIDNFGNLITNIKAEDLPNKARELTITIGSKKIHGLTRTYAEGSGLLGLIGSQDYLEISLKNGNASDFIGVGIGDPVRVVKTGGK
jgi:hypothetical protein